MSSASTISLKYVLKTGVLACLENQAESLKPTIFPNGLQGLSGFNWVYLMTDNIPGNGGVVTVVGSSGIWFRIDLGTPTVVAKIIIETIVPETVKDQLTGFELRVGG